MAIYLSIYLYIHIYMRVGVVVVVVLVVVVCCESPRRWCLEVHAWQEGESPGVSR